MARQLRDLALNRARAVIAVIALAVAGGWAVAVMFGVGFGSLPSVPRAVRAPTPLLPSPPSRVPTGRLFITPSRPAAPPARPGSAGPALGLPAPLVAPVPAAAPAPVLSVRTPVRSGGGGASEPSLSLGRGSARSLAALLLGGTAAPRTALLPTAVSELPFFVSRPAPRLVQHPGTGRAHPARPAATHAARAARNGHGRSGRHPHAARHRPAAIGLAHRRDHRDD